MIKLFLNVISLISIVFALTACGVNKNTTAKNKQATPQANQSNYYDQFIFKVHGDCKEPNSVSFSSLFSWEPALIGKDFEGNLVYSYLSIQLFSDGTYWAEYTELALKKIETGGRTYKTIFYKDNLNGNWVINNNRIELSGIGYGVPTKNINHSNGKISDAIRFTMTSVINNYDALNAEMKISGSLSGEGPKGISVNQYCNIH